jgi:hypothetical protein
MKKNVIYLSPNFPTNFRHFSVALKRSGAQVLGIGEDPYHQLNTTLKDVLTEYYKVNDVHNYDELIRACGYFTHKYGKIDRLDSLNEYWLDTEARLRDDFNICGLREKDMKNIKCKSAMKEVYQKIGLRVAKGKIAKTLHDAEQFIKDVGYPIVLKPDTGVGATSTHKINNASELKKVFAEITENVSYIMEEFITGDIYSFDGLADSSSNAIFYTAHVFSQGIMEIVNDDTHLNYYSLTDLPRDLEEAGKKCLKAFNVKERFFHLEFFHTPKGDFVPLEVNIRPPGGFSIDMMNYGSDIDLFQAWADLIVNGKTELEYERKYYVLYAGRKNGINYINSHREILQKYGKKISLHQELPLVFRNALGDYCYITKSEDFTEIEDMTDFIQSVSK